jgi:hypothetical protein
MLNDFAEPPHEIRQRDETHFGWKVASMNDNLVTIWPKMKQE